MSATYGGSAIFSGGGSATFIPVVSQGASRTALTSSRNPSVYGQSVTLTTRVSPAAATGTVQFTLDGGPVGGPVTVDATGRATLVTNILTVGAHTVSVAYNGNVDYRPSASANLTQTVSKASSRTVVTSSGSPATRGTTVVFTATVTVTARAPGAGTPSGTVQFRIGGVNTGAAVALNSSGRVAHATSTLPVGRHTVCRLHRWH